MTLVFWAITGMLQFKPKIFLAKGFFSQVFLIGRWLIIFESTITQVGNTFFFYQWESFIQLVGSGDH
jgi:hypothetical protein